MCMLHNCTEDLPLEYTKANVELGVISDGKYRDIV